MHQPWPTLEGFAAPLTGLRLGVYRPWSEALLLRVAHAAEAVVPRRPPQAHRRILGL